MIKNLPKTIFFVAFFSLVSIKSISAAELTITPAISTVTTSFDVTINVDPKGASVSGVDAIIKYEPEKLEATLIQNGVFEQYLKKNINKTTGIIEISAYNTTTLITAPAIVAKVTFKPLVTTGTSPVSFIFTQGSQTGSHVASNGKDILETTVPATYTIAATATTTTTTTTTPPATTTSVPVTTTTVPATGNTENLYLFIVLSCTLITFGGAFVYSARRP